LRLGLAGFSWRAASIALTAGFSFLLRGSKISSKADRSMVGPRQLLGFETTDEEVRELVARAAQRS
jgi:hypothetical protein